MAKSKATVQESKRIESMVDIRKIVEKTAFLIEEQAELMEEAEKAIVDLRHERSGALEDLERVLQFLDPQ